MAEKDARRGSKKAAFTTGATMDNSYGQNTHGEPVVRQAGFRTSITAPYARMRLRLLQTEHRQTENTLDWSPRHPSATDQPISTRLLATRPLGPGTVVSLQPGEVANSLSSMFMTTTAGRAPSQCTTLAPQACHDMEIRRRREPAREGATWKDDFGTPLSSEQAASTLAWPTAQPRCHWMACRRTTFQA